MFDADVVLPPNQLLLHVGPHKTGTTAVQSSFHRARKRLRAEGIKYGGKDRQPMRAAIAITTGRASHGALEPELRLWERLCREAERNSDKRVVISSEFFCEADEDAVPKVVEGLGGERVHVIVTLRPLWGVMPSQWQQYLQNGLLLDYDDWLDLILNMPRYTSPSPFFWRRHDHGDVVERWANVVGPDNVVAVMPDQHDRGSLLHTFESILGLERGFLVPDPAHSNRGLTLGEVDLLRAINIEFANNKWKSAYYHQLMRHGVIKSMVTSDASGADGRKMTTPRWALEDAAKRGAEAARRIEASGVHVIGDLSQLSSLPSNPDEIRENADPLPTATPSVATAVAAVMGAFYGSGATEERPVKKAKVQAVKETSTKDLAKVIADRARQRVRPSSGR